MVVSMAAKGAKLTTSLDEESVRACVGNNTHASGHGDQSILLSDRIVIDVDRLLDEPTAAVSRNSTAFCVKRTCSCERCQGFSGRRVAQSRRCACSPQPRKQHR